MRRSLGLSASRCRLFSYVAAMVSLTALGAGRQAAAQGLAPPAFATPQISTHDWTSTPGSSPNLAEVWADVKSPGDGFHYAVGTIVVTDTVTPPTFSSIPVAWPAGLTAPQQQFLFAPGRQIVIVQCTDDAGAIVWQNYFYGFVPSMVVKSGSGNGRANNARSISVFPAAAVADTRVVICGETYDEVLPFSQFTGGIPAGWPTSSATNPAGFIAVYDGGGALLWTRQFFGRDDNGDCAVTDVSVRVVFTPNGVPIADEVTYCGISTHGIDLVGGVPTAANAALTPVNWFVAPTPAGSGPGIHLPAGGATDNGIGQWDGFVGRITNAHVGGTGPTVMPVFHSVVGGKEQDGLFGLAEITPERFAVAGGSAISTPGTPAPGVNSFPFTWGTTPPIGGSIQWPWLAVLDYCVGVAAVFDAAGTPGGAPLVLEAADPMGSVIPVTHSCARDVHVAFGGVLPGAPLTQGAPALHFVGSTDDAAFIGFVAANPGPQPVIGGMTDGFLASAPGNAATWIDFQEATFYGGALADGLMGVGGWNEHPDHVAVFGFTDRAGLNRDFEVGSFFLMSGAAPGAVAPLQLLRRDGFYTNGVEQPNAMGAINAMTAGLGYAVFGLDEPQGGGIGVDERGRVNLVGSTVATNYPVFGIGSRAFLGGIDAVRTAVDPVPPTVGRTDGTGSPPGFVPPAPANGGMTPFCALGPFGTQLGLPAPPLARALIDWEGVAPGFGVTGAILVDRLPAGAAMYGAALQFGLPDPVPTPLFGIELWADNSPTIFALPTPSGSLRWPLAALPPAPFAATAQVYVFASAPFACNGQPAAATAGLFFAY